MAKVYALILGQCSPTIHDHIKLQMNGQQQTMPQEWTHLEIQDCMWWRTIDMNWQNLSISSMPWNWAKHKLTLVSQPEEPGKIEQDMLTLLSNTSAAILIFMMCHDATNMLTFITDQMTPKQGLKHFWSAGSEAIMKELEQLIFRMVTKTSHRPVTKMAWTAFLVWPNHWKAWHLATGSLIVQNLLC